MRSWQSINYSTSVATDSEEDFAPPPPSSVALQNHMCFLKRNGEQPSRLTDQTSENPSDISTEQLSNLSVRSVLCESFKQGRSAVVHLPLKGETPVDE